MHAKRRVIYHDFRRRPIPPTPEPPHSGLLAVVAVTVLLLLVLGARHAFGDVRPACWGVQVSDDVSSYHYKAKGDCERMRLAIIASVCEQVHPESHRAACYEQGPPKVRCVPVDDPVCKETP